MSNPRGPGGSRGRPGDSRRGSSSTRGSSAGGSRDCFYCGRPGHFARECPSNQGISRDRGRGAGPPQPGQSSTIPSHRGPPPATGAQEDAIAPGIYMAPAQEPDASITAAEDALVKVTRDRMFEDGPGRRGYGTLGTPIRLRTNYLRLYTPLDATAASLVEKAWYCYHVTPAQELPKLKRRLFLQEILKHARFQQMTVASDFSSIIVTNTSLDLGKENEWQGEVVIPSANADTNGQVPQQGPVPAFVQAARARNTVRFRLTSQGSFSLRHLIDYLRSTSAEAAYQGRVDIIPLLNIIMCMPLQRRDDVVNVGQNVFYPFAGNSGKESYQLGAGLVALRGYYISARPAINRLLVNLNVTSGAFYNNVSVENLLRQAGLWADPKGEAFIRLLKINVDYGNGKKRTKTIIGFAKEPNQPTFCVPRFGNARQVQFQMTGSNGKQSTITVEQYFKQAHNITLQKPTLAVLNTGTTREPQYVPMELCTVVEGQPYRRLLGGEQTSAMIKFAARAPNLNAMSIAGTPQQPGNGVTLFQLASNPPNQDPQADYIKPFGFNVDPKMLTVPARILTAPKINYLNANLNPRSGSWNCAKQKFSLGGNIGKWQVWMINRQALAQPSANARTDYALTGGNPEGLFRELEGELRDYRIRMGERLRTKTITLNAFTEANRASNDSILETAFDTAAANGVQMLFIVLPDADRWLYARIKFYGDIKYGIHSINTVGRKFQKETNRGMFIGNLALKFNVKGGGVCHRIDNTLTRPLDKNTMLIGIDVTHPSPGSSEGAPSIACIVASTDENLSQWPGSIRSQTGRQEMVDGLEEMILERLDLWGKRNKSQLPTKIVVYRDGVSEGQYKSVLEKELPPFQEAFKKRYGAQESKWPKMAIIVVGKRHHTRFYPMRQEDADYDAGRGKGSWNPRPGTVVDRGIANRVLREFWLQAHQGLQGTARPAHYVVIKDDIKFEADDMERITHHLCYTFNRAPKAVSICPPAYYADLLCERGRSYLHSTFAESHGSDAAAFNAATAEWTRGVHPRLAESTWYI